MAVAQGLLDRTSSSLDMDELGPIAGDVGRVRYDADNQKRIYLFGGDIRAGLTSADVLELPQQAMPIPGPGGPASVDIGPFNPAKWLSMRAYDVGLCSIFPDPAFPQLRWPAVANGFIAGLDRAFAGAVGATRIERATFRPILQTTSDFDSQGDRFGFSVSYFAQNIGGALGCNDVTIRLSAEIGWHRVPGAVLNPPQCLSPSDKGGVLVPNDGYTWDFPGVIDAFNLTVDAPNCLTVGEIRNNLFDALNNEETGLPGAFDQAILDQLLVDPRSFGVPVDEIRPCTCDSECNDFAPDGPLPYAPGHRNRCKLTDPNPDHPCGECWIQLDPDRLQARPEGLEIVLAEDRTDPQASLLESTLVMCSPTRLSVLAGSDPLETTLPGPISVPVTAPPPPPTPFCSH